MKGSSRADEGVREGAPFRVVEAVMEVTDGAWGRGRTGAISYMRRSGRLPRGGEASVESWRVGRPCLAGQEERVLPAEVGT